MKSAGYQTQPGRTHQSQQPPGIQKPRLQTLQPQQFQQQNQNPALQSLQ